MSNKDHLNKILYPPILPYRTELLKVSDLHTIYVEQSGNPNGVPVIFLHGGPGGGCSDYHRQFFDPQHYRAVLFDQRGCGRSTPFAELRENTTWDLIADIETIRVHLGIETWYVFGGSWGSTLALAYAQTHPERCLGLVVRGIFTLQQRELDWLYRDGASRYFPDAWEKFVTPVAKAKPEDYVDAYYKLLTHEDPQVRIPAATAWSIWEATLANLVTDPDMVRAWGSDQFAQAVARIECHYFYNHGWFRTDTQLFDDIPKIQHLPAVIIHGRYDALCPPEMAWELHKLWPGSKLKFVDAAGHAATEPGIASSLRQAMDDFRTAT